MAELKTRPDRRSVPTFLESVKHDTRHEVARAVLTLFKRVSGMQPVM